MKDAKTLRFEMPAEAIGVVTLNRPERLNAMSRELIREFHECLGEIAQRDDIRVVILTGAGRGFCAGTDLKDSASAEGMNAVPDALVGQRQVSSMVALLRRIPQPVIAAVNGVAAGGGFSLTMACDVRIAAESARFVASYVNIGLSACEMGSSYFLPRLIGHSRASEILYTGRMLEADEAERIGYVSRVVPDGQALEAALEVAGQMASKSPFGLRMTKEVLNQTIDAPSLEAALAIEDRTQMLAVRTEDFREAVAAFVEKRPPKFQGK